MNVMSKQCVVCSVILTGNQSKYCSRKCKNKTTNIKHQVYENQQRRAVERKLLLIQEAGGCCSVCAYDKNLAGLVFHHTDPSRKDFQLTARECSNNSLETLRQEAKKCILLCQNCHMETHYPDLGMHLLKSSALTD